MNSNKKRNKVYGLEFFKYSGALLSSNFIAQLIGFGIYPIITRHYSPEVMGEFSLLLSIAGILSTLSTGKYELAIVLPKSDKDAKALTQLALSWNIVCFVICFFIISIWEEGIASCFEQSNLISSLAFLPFFIIVLGLWQILNYFFNRYKKFYNISLYNIIQSSIGSGLKVFLGIKGFIQTGLIWGTFLGQFTALFISIIIGWKQLKTLFRFDVNTIKQVAKRYRNFPKYELPHSLFNNFAGNLPIFLLPFFFGMENVGLFSLALTFGFRPVNLFCESIHQVLFKKMSEKVQNFQAIKTDFVVFCKTCSIILIPVFLLIFSIPNSVFGFIFGEKWIISGTYLKWMLPWLFSIVLTASLSFIPNLFFKQKTALFIEIIYVLARLSALFIGIYLQSFLVAISLFCCVSAFMMIVKLIWYYFLIIKYESSSHDKNTIDQE